jgi:hypothetical protein
MSELERMKQQIEDIEYDLNALTGDLSALRNGLIKSKLCDHSETEEYIWEHDNGYGRQTRIQGKCCKHCLFIDRWCTGRFSE